MENTSYKIASLDVLGFLDEMELSAMLNRNMIDRDSKEIEVCKYNENDRR